MTDLEKAIQEAEDKLNEARRYVAEYKALYERWTNEVAIAMRVWDGLRAAAGLPVDDRYKQQRVPTVRLPADDREAILEGKKRTTWVAPRKEVEAAKPASTFQARPVANGFDRLAAKRACRQWHIRYPVSPSNQTASAFEKQALTRVVVDSDGYDDWLAQGGISLTSNSVWAGTDDRNEAAKFCGIDARAVRKQARALLDDIMTYGVKGEDYV